ncbi:hypothetical protein FCV25MIE_04473, partial [Fagus crenata]
MSLMVELSQLFSQFREDRYKEKEAQGTVLPLIKKKAQGNLNITRVTRERKIKLCGLR